MLRIDGRSRILVSLNKQANVLEEFTIEDHNGSWLCGLNLDLSIPGLVGIDAYQSPLKHTSAETPTMIYVGSQYVNSIYNIGQDKVPVGFTRDASETEV